MASLRTRSTTTASSVLGVPGVDVMVTEGVADGTEVTEEVGGDVWDAAVKKQENTST